MSITITGKLNNPANQFQAGDSTGFGIRLGVQYYDRETSSKEWTNYSCVIFAKNDNQIQFLQDALVKGAVVEVTAKQAKIEEYNGNHSIALIDSSIGYIGTVSQSEAPQAPQAAPSAKGYFFQDGTAMNPEQAQYYISRGVQPWPKGTPPPVV